MSALRDVNISLTLKGSAIHAHRTTEMYNVMRVEVSQNGKAYQ